MTQNSKSYRKIFFNLKTLFIKYSKHVYKTQRKNDSTETFQLPSSLYTNIQLYATLEKKVDQVSHGSK